MDENVIYSCVTQGMFFIRKLNVSFKGTPKQFTIHQLYML